MKLFLDTGKLEEIELVSSIIDGVTTNPSLIKKAAPDLDLKKYLIKILKAVRGKPVSIEVIATDVDGMVEQGLKIHQMFSRYGNIYVKIPINPVFKGASNYFDGVKAIRKLSRSGVRVNATLIFTPEQALLAAKAGARFVSPFAGRIDDLLRRGKFNKSDYYPAEGLKRDDNGVVSGVDLVAQIVEIFRLHDINCKVLAASIRNARQMREMALVGADIATVPLYVLEESIKHQKTIEGMAKFSADVIPEYRDLLQ